MKLAISNIAWQSSEDQKIYSLLHKLQIQGLEIAPSKLFNNPYQRTAQEISKRKEQIGLQIVSMQSLLFGYDGLHLFKDRESREKLLVHLKGTLDFAEAIGSRCVVFGSPKNRLIGESDPVEARSIAIDFFRSLAEYAKERGVYFLMEANPEEYGADFITDTAQAIDLIKEVNSAHFQLNLDLATITMKAEEKIIPEAIPYAKHVHISEPYLNPVPQQRDYHERYAQLLRENNYQNWLSIEMRASSEDDNLNTVKHSLEFVKEVYTS